MRSFAINLLRFVLFSIIICILPGAGGRAQTAPTMPQASGSGASFGYSCRPITLPFQLPAGTVVTVVPPSGLEDINDAGEVAFSAGWYPQNKLYDQNKRHAGVYTSKRTVVEVGDIIDGKKIFQIEDVQINNAGQVSYRAQIFSPPSRKGFNLQGCFLERKLKFLLPDWVSWGAGVGEDFLCDNGHIYYQNDAAAGRTGSGNHVGGVVTSDGIYWLSEDTFPAEFRKLLADRRDEQSLGPKYQKQWKDVRHWDRYGFYGPAGLVLRGIVAAGDKSQVVYVNDKGTPVPPRSFSSFHNGVIYFSTTDAIGHVTMPAPIGYVAVPSNQPPVPPDVPFSTVLTDEFLVETNPKNVP